MRYQKVLGRDISEKTAIEIERILNYIQHPVIFQELPAGNTRGFGISNYVSEPNWIVYSVTDIPQPAFEANLLHELYHLCQIVEGFPTTSTKTISSSPEEQNYINRAGGAVTSVILDLDVCDRINKFGLNSNYFFDVRYNQATSSPIPEKIVVRDVFVLMTVHLAGIILQNSNWQSSRILQRYEAKNIRLVRKARGLASRIKKCGYSIPEECFRCLVTAYDYLDIWNWQTINYCGHQIQSSEQANTFLSGSHQSS